MKTEDLFVGWDIITRVHVVRLKLEIVEEEVELPVEEAPFHV